MKREGRKMINQKKITGLCLALSVLLACVSPSFAEKTDSMEITLYPGETKVLELDGSWGIQPDRFVINENIPGWLRDEMRQQLESIQMRPIDVVAEASVSVGDVNRDDYQDILVTGAKGSLDLFLYSSRLERAKFMLFQTISFPGLDTFLHPVIGREMTRKILFFSAGTTVYQCDYEWENDQFRCSEPFPIYESTIANDVLIPALFRLNRMELVLGHLDGTLSLIQEKQEGEKWVEDSSFFPHWTELWDEENPNQEGVVVSGRASPYCYWENEKTGWLLVGDQDGSLDTFRIQMDQQPIIFQTYPLVKNWQTAGNCSPFLLDVQGDGSLDLGFASTAVPLSYLTNYSHQKGVFQFVPYHSEADKSPIGMFFGGTGFVRDSDTLYATRYNQTETKLLLDFLNTVPPEYIDEVAFCVTNFQVEDLLIYIRQELLPLLVENAKSITDMCEQVQYVKMKQYPDYSTLEYATDTGFVEMPREIYYQYLVMLNRYIMSPNAYKTAYQGNFYRTFLPTDTKYGTTLLERVKEAKTLYEAAYLVDFWLKQDIGGIWHTGKKPSGWYNIYQNLLNKDLGIWCGEWSIIYEAAARAMNIPTIIIVALGEDHQFNNFWADGWHHVDSSSGEGGEKSSWKPYFDDSLIYYKSWGKRIFSWPMCWESNGKYDHVWRSKLPYNPEELLTDLHFIVKDEEGQPLDGSRVELWSHWPMEGKYQPVPFVSAIGYANANGVAKIEQVGHQRFTVYVVTRIGTVNFPFSIPDGVREKEIHVTIPGRKPCLVHLSAPQQMNYENIPENESFSLWIDPHNPDLVYVDKKTNATYAETNYLLKKFKTISWNIEPTTMVLEFRQTRVVFTANESYYDLNGKRVTTPTPVWVKNGQKYYLQVRPIADLFGAKLNWDGKTQTITISWIPVQQLPITIECKPTYLEVFPWVDAYYTQLRYMEYWFSETSPLEICCTDKAGLESFTKGESVRSGFYRKIKKTEAVNLRFPVSEKQYLILHNPSLSAVCRFVIRK